MLKEFVLFCKKYFSDVDEPIILTSITDTPVIMIPVTKIQVYTEV